MIKKAVSETVNQPIPVTAGTGERFTRNVWLEGSLGNKPNLRLRIVYFEPRARTHWHHHTEDQLLYVLSGKARIRMEGEDKGLILHQGERIRIPKDTRHWQGASLDIPMVHIAINLGRTIWNPDYPANQDKVEPVSDEEYEAGFETK